MKHTKAWRERYQRRWSRRRREALKAKGICPNCAKRKAKLGHVCCELCLENKRVTMRLRTIVQGKYGRVVFPDAAQAQKHIAKGICQICRRKGKVVDHCHRSGLYRGFLCRQCNAGLGFFRDDITLLRKAIVYLRKFSTGRT